MLARDGFAAAAARAAAGAARPQLAAPASSQAGSVARNSSPP
jgi:hypothetical protein